MPSIVTHHVHGRNVIRKIDNKNINEDIYDIFNQSFDYLFYYPHLDFKMGKEYRNFGHYCHKSNTQLYIINIIKNIKKLNLENNKDAIGYLYGSINHYTLDTLCHPYIFYKTGCFYKENKKTYKYQGMHSFIEKNLDCYFSKLFFKKPLNKLDVNKEIIKKAIFSKELNELIDITFKETYNKDNISNIYYKSYKNSKLMYKYLVQDKNGIKKKLYSLIDYTFNRKGEPLRYHSFYIINENLSFLNITHKTWCHPCDNNTLYEESFLDLFAKATEESIKIINEVNKVLYENKDIKSLTRVLPNLSYITGLPIEKNKSLRYFEY